VIEGYDAAMTDPAALALRIGNAAALPELPNDRLTDLVRRQLSLIDLVTRVTPLAEKAGMSVSTYLRSTDRADLADMIDSIAESRKALEQAEGFRPRAQPLVDYGLALHNVGGYVGEHGGRLPPRPDALIAELAGFLPRAQQRLLRYGIPLLTPETPRLTPGPGDLPLSGGAPDVGSSSP